MLNEDFDVLYKVVLVGDAGVGKTNLLEYFTRHADDENPDPNNTADSFNERRKPTIGVEFGTKTILHPDGTRIRAQIWDTAGQERYRAITSSHYRRAAGAMLVYDVTNPKTLENACDSWLKELKDASDDDCGLLSCIMLCGNKTDLEGTEAGEAKGFITKRQHAEACEKYRLYSKRTSAKSGVNVSAAFKELIIHIHNNAKKNDDEEDYADPVVIGRLVLVCFCFRFYFVYSG